MESIKFQKVASNISILYLNKKREFIPIICSTYSVYLENIVYNVLV